MLGLLPDKSRTHKMLGQKRKIFDMSDELDASVAAVESIIRRIQCVNDPQYYHLLPGLMREFTTESNFKTGRSPTSALPPTHGNLLDASSFLLMEVVWARRRRMDGLNYTQYVYGRML